MNQIYNELTFLNLKALSIKKRFIKMCLDANAGHIGSCLSCADIISYLFCSLMKDNDEFILSKGHAAACLYSALAEIGILNEKDILSFYKNGTYLSAHPPGNKIKGVSFATGSLGHGLSLAAGKGLAKKFKKEDSNIFCLTSDGELNEGSIWEAAQFISHYNLTNVIWIIDKNNIQGFGKTEEVLNPLNLKSKIESFGFEVDIVNGHNFIELLSIKNSIKKVNKPLSIIANTIKGKDWFLENTVDCHYLTFKNEDYIELIRNLELTHSKKIDL